MSSGINRPLKYGPMDRREYIVEDSEVSFVAINDTDGNPIYYGRAKAGTALSEEKWQIRYIQYDENQGVTRITWPQDEDGNASTDYKFVWTSWSPLTITDISQANPAVVTVVDVGALQNGDPLVIEGVAGMIQVNFNGGNIYVAANVNAMANTFELSGVDSSGYTAYSSGGEVDFGDFLTYTYS